MVSESACSALCTVEAVALDGGASGGDVGFAGCGGEGGFGGGGAGAFRGRGGGARFFAGGGGGAGVVSGGGSGVGGRGGGGGFGRGGGRANRGDRGGGGGGPAGVRGTRAGGAFAVGFFLLDEGGFGGLQRGPGLFEGDFGGVGVQFGEQLALGDVGALGDKDLGNDAGGLEAEVELGGGLDGARAGDGRLDDSLADGDDPAGAGGVPRGGPDDEHGGDDRAEAESAEKQGGPRPGGTCGHVSIMGRSHKACVRRLEAGETGCDRRGREGIRCVGSRILRPGQAVGLRPMP